MADAERGFRRWLLLVCLVTVGWFAALSLPEISGFRFPDPDDVMRLVEVRDWLNGQYWFDVSQHRMNPPYGLSMHWSRLIDLPIAALIVLIRPFAGPHMAETIAAAAVPMLTFGIVVALVALLARRWVPPPLALLAAALCPISVASWFALRPMRIDHHGWQIASGLGIVLALTGAPTRRNAAVAGLCAALWTHISLEGLPFGAAAGAWLGLCAIFGMRKDGDRLSAYLAAFTIGAAALLLGVKGPGAVVGLHCDSLSIVHVAGLGIVTLASLIAVRASLPFRVAVLLLGGAIGALLYRLAAAPCVAGPFGQLGPLGYRVWYSAVNEGLPVWRLSPTLVLLWAPFPFVGLCGAIAGWWKMPPGEARRSLATYIALLAAATAVGVLVMRASALSNLLALPGAMIGLWAVVRASHVWPRALRSISIALAMLICTPFGPALLCLLAPSPPAVATAPHAPCGSLDDFAALNALPAAVVIAPIGMGPTLLAASHHVAIAGPYHRDPGALEDLLRFFMANPDVARSIARERHATLLAFCPGDSDLAVMAKRAPQGLAAMLQRGSVPWLERLYLPGGSPLLVYRIDTAAS